MKHSKFIAVFIVGLSVFCLYAYVSGPPAGTTNAPGETTCYSSPACHSGTPDSGLGFGEMTIMGGVPTNNLYVPGQVYTMMPYCVDTTMSKGGFQVVALFSSGSLAGTNTITNQTNTQIISSGGRDYVEQTATGAVAPNFTNMHDWMYDWQAPAAGSGTVTFYVAFVAANNDNTPSGDNIYTDTLTLYEDTTASVDYAGSRRFEVRSVFPLPARDRMVVDVVSHERRSVNLVMYTISGQKVRSVKRLVHPGFNRLSMDVSGLSAGTYLLRVDDLLQNIFRKVVVE